MKLKRLSLSVLALSMLLVQIPSVARAEDIRTKTKKEEINTKVEEIKARTRERVSELKAKAEQKTTEVRIKSCEARKTNIENRLANRIEAAKRHKSKFDSIYTRIQDYALEKSVTSADITALQTNVSTEGQKVNDGIDALETLNVAIDCSNPDNVAVGIETYKDQVSLVKSALKDYRESIRNYAQAVKKVAEANEGIEQ